VILSNISKDVIIGNDVHYADSWLSRLMGLMFHQSLNENQGLVLPQCKVIHTFFVSQALKVLVLDINKKLIDKFEIFPRKISKIYSKAYYFLEISQENKIYDLCELNDLITWQFKPRN
jgi:uncharacterized membrane protein (UPF0127 family)